MEKERSYNKMMSLQQQIKYESAPINSHGAA